MLYETSSDAICANIALLGRGIDMDGTPSEDTVRRAEAVAEYYEAFGQKIGRIVCSGGFPARFSEPPSGREALCLEDVLVRKGVPACKIEVEDQSVCTFTNLEKIAEGGYFDNIHFSPENPLGIGAGKPHFERIRPIAQQVFAIDKASVNCIAPLAENNMREYAREKIVGAPMVRWALRNADPGNLIHTADARKRFYAVGARPARLYLRTKERFITAK
jgi:hypothetical protein